MGYVKRSLLPKLSSNTCDFCTVKSNSIYGGYNVYKAFNGTNDSDSDCYISNVNNGDENIYIQIDLQTPTYICGLNITSRNGSPVYDGDYKLYLSDNGIMWKELLSVSTQSTPNTDKEVMFYPKKCKYLKLEGLSRDVNLAIGKLEFYVIEEFYAIKQNGKYYSFNEEQYDTETKMFKEITVQDIKTTINNKYLSEKGYLTQEYNIDGETFRPIDKFGDEFQLVSIERRDININAVKSKRELVVANGDINVNIADHIDFFESTYDLSAGNIKVAISIDQGSTWKTTSDNGTSWSSIDLDKDQISANGIGLDNLKDVDFNTLFEQYASTDDRLIRLAYVIDIDAVEDCPNTTELKWQFDAKGRFKHLGTDKVDVETAQDYVSITPKESMDMMKVVLGTGGNLTVNEITNNNVADEATAEEISDMVKEVIG